MSQPETYQLGKMQRLTIRRIDEQGTWLGNWDNLVLLHAEDQMPEYKPGLMRNVFVYKHPTHGLLCTTKVPDIEVDEIGFCEVRSVSPKGATVDIGNGVRALIPAKLLKKVPAIGMMLPVYLHLDDKTQTLMVDTRVERHLLLTGFKAKVGQQVQVVVLRETNLGYKVVIEKKYGGLMYKNEVFKPIFKGESLPAYIKKIRDDGQIDLTLRAPGYQEVEINMQRLLQLLRDNGGFLPVGDKSPPAAVYEYTEMSKKTFKQAAGGLYKKGLIWINDFDIKLQTPPAS